MAGRNEAATIGRCCTQLIVHSNGRAMRCVPSRRRRRCPSPLLASVRRRPPPTPSQPRLALRCALCAVHCSLCALRCALCSVRCALRTVRCALCAACCSLCAVRCVLCAVCCALYAVRCTLCCVSTLVLAARPSQHSARCRPPPGRAAAMLAAHAPRLAGSVRCALAGTRAPACVRALGSHADSAGTAGSSKVDSQTGSAPPGGAPRGAASPGGPAPRGKEPGPPFAPSQSPLSAYEGPHGGRNGGGDGHGKDSGELSEAERLVDAMQPHVLARGWTSDAVDAALADLGWSPAAVGLLGRSGVLGAPGVLVRRWNRELATSLADRGGDEVAEGEAVERAASAIRQRIEMATPVRSRWSEALQILAQPRNVKASTVSSAELADEIAHYAGYRSPDVCVLAGPSCICHGCF